MTDDLFAGATALRRKPMPPKGRAPTARAGTPGEAEYNASSIEVLEGLEPVRRRPGMYIGGTDANALHHLFAEVIDNAMDEAVAGHATFIEVSLEEGGWLSVTRQRARHAGRPASEISRQVGARNHHDQAARRRQIRQRRLRDLGRPARRRRLGGQRPLGAHRGRGGARPDALPAGVRARPSRHQAGNRRQGAQPARHQGALPARRADFRRRRAIRSRRACSR